MTFNEQILELLIQSKKNVKTAVNIAMVYTYYEIGRRIVEEEQHGNGRADYGKYLLKELSGYLTENFGKGFSLTNLKRFHALQQEGSFT